MLTVKQLGEQAIAKLKSQGKTEEEIGKTLGTANEQQLKDIVGLPTTRPDVDTGTDIGSLASGLSSDAVRFSFDPMSMLANQPSVQSGEASIKRNEAGIRESVDTALTAQKAITSRQFEQQINAIKEQMDRELSGTTALSARSSGLGATTTLQSNLNMVKKSYDERVASKRQEMNDALARNNMAAASQIQASLERENASIDKLYDKAWKMNVDVFNIQNQELANQRAEVQMNWNIVSKLKKGDNWTSPAGITYEGISEVEPFYKSGDIISLMKDLPVGQTQNITDPYTGELWSISGIGQPKTDTKVFTSTDAAGNYHIISFDTIKNEVTKEVTLKGIGKPMSAGGSGAGGGDKEKEYNETVDSAAVLFEEDRKRNQDEKVSPDLYEDLRNEVAPSKRADFDKRFSSLLSPESLRRFAMASEAEKLEKVEKESQYASESYWDRVLTEEAWQDNKQDWEKENKKWWRIDKSYEEAVPYETWKSDTKQQMILMIKEWEQLGFSDEEIYNKLEKLREEQ